MQTVKSETDVSDLHTTSITQVHIDTFSIVKHVSTVI